jgi:N-methylhydantoinase B
MALDQITLEILTQALVSTVRDMRATVCRTASSVAIYDAKDFSCGLFGPDSQVVAQSEDIGSHVVPMPWTVRSAMQKLGSTLKPGDAILVNDPYSGGTHLNDVTVIWPVFKDGRLIFFPAVRAHWSDVGGMVPGSMSGKATEIYQEGIRIPPLKVMEGGIRNGSLIDLLLANMRVPEERLGDLNASFAACRVAERRIHEICDRYGVDTLLEAVKLDMDRAEARMRECISRLPDGVYHYEDYLETFMKDKFEPLLLPIKLTIAGARMTADFTGASQQVPFPVNSTAAVSAASVFIAMKSIFDPQAPLNQGSFRPIDVITPPRTIVNVQRPAPAGSHGEIRKRVVATMVGALSQVVPDKVAGDLCRTSFHNLLGGFDTRLQKEWVHYEWSSGGNGAFEENDGPSAMATIDWGDLVTVQSTEVIESRLPVLVESSRLATDSGGPGKTRGGLSMQRQLRVLAPEATYSLLSDGAIVPAFGVLGGHSGLPVGAWTERGGEIGSFNTPGKIAGHPVPEGSSVIIRSAGGGGYGDPLKREPEQVASDLREGYISEDVARQVYGVACTDGGAVDSVATNRLRASIADKRVRLLAATNEQDAFEAGLWSKRRVFRLCPADASRLDIENDDLIEVDAGIAAPLRGWARIDERVKQGTVPLDQLANKILKIEPRVELEIRKIAGAGAKGAPTP